MFDAARRCACVHLFIRKGPAAFLTCPAQDLVFRNRWPCAGQAAQQPRLPVYKDVVQRCIKQETMTANLPRERAQCPRPPVYARRLHVPRDQRPYGHGRVRRLRVGVAYRHHRHAQPAAVVRPRPAAGGRSGARGRWARRAGKQRGVLWVRRGERTSGGLAWAEEGAWAGSRCHWVRSGALARQWAGLSLRKVGHMRLGYDTRRQALPLLCASRLPVRAGVASVVGFFVVGSFA